MIRWILQVIFGRKNPSNIPCTPTGVIRNYGNWKGFGKRVTK